MRRELILLLLLGCKAEEPVRVLAAASMADAMAELFPNVQIDAAASSVLARQLESGAPGDLFVSADQEWADYVAGHRKVEAKQAFASNELVLIAPAGDQHPADQLLHLRVALADPTHVPAGKYAQATLQKMSRTPTIAAAADVRAALALVERGEADAGIVYRTDAMLSRKVRIVEELDCPVPIQYFAVLLDARARPLFDRLVGEEGRSVLARYGFQRAQRHSDAKRRLGERSEGFLPP